MKKKITEVKIVFLVRDDSFEALKNHNKVSWVLVEITLMKIDLVKQA